MNRNSKNDNDMDIGNRNGNGKGSEDKKKNKKINISEEMVEDVAQSAAAREMIEFEHQHGPNSYYAQ